jgi:hypothetical protein
MWSEFGDARSKVELISFPICNYDLGSHSDFHYASLHDRLEVQWVQTECNEKSVVIRTQFGQVSSRMSILGYYQAYDGRLAQW